MQSDSNLNEARHFLKQFVREAINNNDFSKAQDGLRVLSELNDVFPIAPTNVELTYTEKDLAYHGKRIDAIRMLRNRITGLGLKEAKDLVEDYLATGYNPDGILCR